MHFESEAIFNFIASLGETKSTSPNFNQTRIFEDFDLSNFGTAPTKFDINVLRSVSKKYLARLSFSEIENELYGLGIPKPLQADFWSMAKENISERPNLEPLWKLCVSGAEPIIAPEDKDFIMACKKLLPPPPLDQQSWSVWTAAIKSETGRSGKQLFLPLRKALTGKENGPDMNKLFPLLQRILF